jgi:hypothetical protein
MQSSSGESSTTPFSLTALTVTLAIAPAGDKDRDHDTSIAFDIKTQTPGDLG